MQINRSFQLITAGSICGLGLIGLLTTSQATSKYLIWVRSEYTKNKETTKAETDKAVADAYAKNQVITFDSLLINDYVLNNQPPRIDWKHTVDPSKKTIIYDQYRRCVGYAHQGKFYFLLYYQGACNNG